MKKEEKQPQIIYQRFMDDAYFYDDFTEEELFTPTSEVSHPEILFFIKKSLISSAL